MSSCSQGGWGLRLALDVGALPGWAPASAPPAGLGVGGASMGSARTIVMKAASPPCSTVMLWKQLHDRNSEWLGLPIPPLAKPTRVPRMGSCWSLLGHSGTCLQPAQCVTTLDRAAAV